MHSTRRRGVLGLLLSAGAFVLQPSCGGAPEPALRLPAAAPVPSSLPPVAAASAPPAQPATPAPSPQPGAAGLRALTPERAVHFRRLSDLRLSPDGGRLAFVVSEPRDTGSVSHVWLADVRSGEVHQATFSAKSERAPQWSPDGRTLAFLSSRGGEMQLYVQPVDGGEASPLTHADDGVGAYAWSPDGAQVAFLATDPGKPGEPPSDAKVADRESDLERIWLVQRASGEVRRLDAGAVRVDELTWPTPGHLLVVATEHPAREAWDAAVYEVDVASGRLSPFARPAQPFSGITPSPGAARLAYVGTATNGPKPHDLFVRETSDGRTRDASRSVDRAVLDVRWQDESTVVARVGDGFRTVLVRFAGSDPPRRIELPTSVRAFDVARDGTLAYVGVGWDRLPELFVAAPDGKVRPLGHVQEAGWEGVTLAPASTFRFKSFDGTSIEAALMTPTVAPPPAGRPLVLLVHGGPNSAYTEDYFWFHAWAQLLVTHGYAVLLVNPRGSTGYGEAFMKANRADWGGGDYRDLMLAVDHVLAGGGIDAKRLGIGGWSYGGEMTSWAIGHTQRFRAAVVGAGVFDQAAEFETERDPAGDEWHFGTPWEHPEVFARNSPSTFIRNARTPTLVVHGEADENNPVGQGRGLYRALKHLGVESQLVTYPGEPHGPRQAGHQIDILERMLRWYDGHMQ